MSLELRPYRPADLAALYRICLLTGDDGRDASRLYADPQLLGHYYAAPYVHHDPELCVVAAWAGEPSGYILGTADSAGFGAWAARHWFPPLRARFPLPASDDGTAEAGAIRLLHGGYRPAPDLQAYPGHLHIDLLPHLQGQGVGKRLLAALLERLRARGCPAVHLGVSEANAGGLAFYEKVGFHLIGRYPGWRAYGMNLG